MPDNDTSIPSEPSANSTIAGGATTASNSTGNSTGNTTANVTSGNSTVNDDSTAYANVSLNGPSAQQMAREVHYLLDPTPLELVTKALGQLNTQVHLMCQLDGYTCNKAMNAFYRDFSCNGTEAATLAAQEAVSKFLNASRNSHNIHAVIEGELEVNETNAPNFENNTIPLSNPT